jgi:hypothetical protein
MQAAERRRLLLKYVREVEPALVEQFVEVGPPAVVSAMKNTITNMLGTLPPQFFTVTISTVGENMSQLMLSVMMTGYLFRNAQYRLELRNALGGASIRSGTTSSSAVTQQQQRGSSGGSMQRSHSAPQQGSVLDEEAYAPGVQKSRVQVGRRRILRAWVYAGIAAQARCAGVLYAGVLHAIQRSSGGCGS